MLKDSKIGQKLLFMLTGGALVLFGVAISHRPTAVAVPPLPKADDLSAAFRQIASDAIPSIVSIESLTKGKRIQGVPQGSPFDEGSPFRQFFRNDPQLEELFKNRMPRQMAVPPRQSMGSGFIIDAKGVILTNSHVVKGADEVKVRLHDGREFVAKEVKSDPRTDVAIVRIEASDLKPIRLGDSRAGEVGDWVLAIGSPFGLDMSVTAGIISAKGRNRITERADFLQTDAAINPGNSGGPLISMRGEVIGINTAIATESGGYDGIGFAIPTHIAGWVSDQLVSAGEVRRGYIGTQIQAVDAKTAKQFNVKINEGAIVHSVLPGSPAEKAGLEPGDVILSLNGQKIDSPTALQGVVEQLTIGKGYPMEIVRDGQRQKLNVTIEQLPKDLTVASAEEPGDAPRDSKFDKFGLELHALTNDLAKQFGLKATNGLVVTGVQEGSIAEQSGIKAGDMIEKAGGKALNSVEDFEKAKKEFAGGDGLVLNVRSANGRRFFVVMKVE
ncbi:MAG: Do family serine endopeptidase [Schlesneria sp.]